MPDSADQVLSKFFDLDEDGIAAIEVLVGQGFNLGTMLNGIPMLADAELTAPIFLTALHDPAGESAQLLLTPSDITADGGTYTITFDGDTTTALAFDATGTDIKVALEALASVGANNIDVSGDASGVIQVFFQGDLSEQPVTADRLSANGASLTGVDSPYTFESTVFAEGSLAGPRVWTWSVGS